MRPTPWRAWCRGLTACLALAAAVLAPRTAMANGWEHGAIPFEALTAALEFEDAATRARAAQSLGLRGQREASAYLLRALARPEEQPAVRSEIYTALGALGARDGLPVLRACLKEEERQELRADCAAALGVMGAAEALPDLLSVLEGDSSILVRSRAVDALGRFSQDRAVDALAGLLGEGANRSLRPRAVTALGKTGAAGAVKPLLESLDKAKNDAERLNIALALMTLGARDAVGPLTELLARTGNPALRVVIAAALGASRDGNAYPTLVRMLGEESLPVRLVALQSLRSLERAEAAEPIAAMALGLEDRLTAMSDNELIGESSGIVARLEIETVALRALIELGPVAGLEVLLRAARPRTLALDSTAAMALSQAFYLRRRVALYGLAYTDADDAFALLLGPAGVGDSDPRLRAIAVRSLAVLERPGSVKAVLAQLDDDSAEVRWTAASVLGRLGDRAALDPLRAGLRDKVAEVRKQAALALGYLGGRQAEADLERAANTDESAKVREAAKFALLLLRAAD